MELTDFIFAKIREGRTLANTYTIKNGKELPYRRIYSLLQKKIDQHLKGRGDRLILLPGLRGIGKTTVLFQLYRYLVEKKEIAPERVFYVSADEVKVFLDSKLSEVIPAYVENVHQTSLTELDKKIFLLIDEAHFDEEWSKVVKIIYDKNENIFTLVTGSSALKLSVKTDTARRAKQAPMFPVNYSEYLIMKHSIYPPQSTSESIRKVIFQGNQNSVNALQKKELEIKKELIALPHPPRIEFRNFVYYGGFAYGLTLKKEEILERTVDVINRVVRRDVPMIESLNQKSIPLVNKILSFVALQKTGGISQTKLADHLDTSPTMISKILEALQKAEMLFSVKPYGGAGKTVRKPWKYYFLTPTLKASLCYLLGKLDERNKAKYGEFVEHLVASYFFRMSKTLNYPQGIYYDAEDGGADFILKAGEKKIPLEVGVGTKDTQQVENSIKRYNSKHGVLVSDREKTKKEGKIIFIPLETFSFV